MLIPLFLICGVADVKMMTGVVSLLSTGSALPSKHFLFLEEVALPEATINIIIAGKSGLIISVAKPLNEAVSLEGFIIYLFFYKSFIGVSPLPSWSKCDFRAFGAEQEIIYQAWME